MWIKISEAAPDESPCLTATLQVTSSTSFMLEKQTWCVPNCDVARQPITIRHLLTHTSGLDYAGVDAEMATALDRVARPLVLRCEREEVTCLADWVTELAQIPLRHQPGVRYEYGFSLDVLGRVIEVLAGSPLDVVVHDRVLSPLAMHATCWSVAPEDAQDHLAALYKLPCEGVPPELVDDPIGGKSAWVPPKGPAPILGGGGGVETSRGGLVSSLSDYLRFCEMIRRQGELDGMRLLHSDTVTLMTRTNHLAVCLGDPKATTGSNEKRGWNLLGCLQLEQPGAYGWGGWASTLWRVYPHHGTSLVFMTNCIHSFVNTEQLILRHVEGALRVKKPLPKQRWLVPHATVLVTALLGSVLLMAIAAPRFRMSARRSTN